MERIFIMMVILDTGQKTSLREGGVLAVKTPPLVWGIYPYFQILGNTPTIVRNTIRSLPKGDRNENPDYFFTYIQILIKNT